MISIPKSSIPISLFDNVRQNQTNDAHGTLLWPELVQIFEKLGDEEIGRKEDASLFCSANFVGGRRAAKNALHSGMLVLDVDSGATVHDATAVFEDVGIAGLIYTTASHTDEHHKFRVCVPLAQAVCPKCFTKAWHGLNHLFGDIADTSKKTCESMFYVPGHIAGQSRFFRSFDGETFEAMDWIEAAPVQVEQEPMAAPSSTPVPLRPRVRSPRRGLPSLDASDVATWDIRDNPVVPGRAIDAYLDCAENWHHQRFSFMCSVAAKAYAHDYPISEAEIVAIFNQLDAEDGGFYGSSEDQKKLYADADNAIRKAA